MSISAAMRSSEGSSLFSGQRPESSVSTARSSASGPEAPASEGRVVYGFCSALSLTGPVYVASGARPAQAPRPGGAGPGSRAPGCSAVRRELDDLLVGRAVLPGGLGVGDAAERALDDRVGAPLVAGRAVRVGRVDLGRGLRHGLPQAVEQGGAAGREVAAAAERAGQRSGHRVAEDAPQVLVDVAPPAVLEGRALVRDGLVGAGGAAGGAALPAGGRLVDLDGSGQGAE